MNRFALVVFGLLLQAQGLCQAYSASSVFAHNDYARDIPFYTAYDLQVGFIEADVFLADSQLMVAHHKHEIVNHRTLEGLYLKPLRDKIITNSGYVYGSRDKTLTLMIDLKTEAVATLDAVVKAIRKFPELVDCRTLFIMISGNVPSPERWTNYPTFISFDGRPGNQYTRDQWQRIRMISTGFRQHITWDGLGVLPEDAITTMQALAREAHAREKPFRFWATPDSENAWKELMRVKADVIVTDNVAALVKFLRRQ